jgi:hypothetical protein
LKSTEYFHKLEPVNEVEPDRRGKESGLVSPFREVQGETQAVSPCRFLHQKKRAERPQVRRLLERRFNQLCRRYLSGAKSPIAQGENMFRSVWSRISSIYLVAFPMIACAIPCVASAESTVVVYPKPSVRSTSTDFEVTATPVTGDTPGTASSIPTFQFKPNGIVEYSFAQFSFGGTVQVTVTNIAENSISSFSISPAAFAIQGTVNGNTLTFTLPASRYLIVKINSQPELVVAADPLESSQAASGAGKHHVVALQCKPDKYSRFDHTNTECYQCRRQRDGDSARSSGGRLHHPPFPALECDPLPRWRVSVARQRRCTS